MGIFGFDDVPPAGFLVPPDGLGGGVFEPPVFGSATIFGLPVILSMISFVPAPITAPVTVLTTLSVKEFFGGVLLITGLTVDVGVVVLVVGTFGLVVIVGLVGGFGVGGVGVCGLGVVGVIGVCVVDVLGAVLDVSVVLGT